ncbi:MAG: beta-ketoacyl synthase N-terminal-like domain-containing protein [Verrucomicrobiota bacterium]
MPSPSTQHPMTIRGIGAVSPAGWSAGELVTATLTNKILAHEELAREGCQHTCKIRRVPKPQQKLPFARHPRLRRASAISRYVAAAGLEALGDTRATAVSQGELRLGIIVVFATGCVTYTRRFFEEMLEDPALASPILFPETVFNAPASHLSAILGSTGISYTLLADSAGFLSGLQLARDWLFTDQCDGCLVIGAEEIDWLISEAVHLFSREAILAEGAGALYLERSESLTSSPIPEVQLSQLTPPLLYTNQQDKKSAAAKMCSLLEIDPSQEKQCLLVDGLQGVRASDKIEASTWHHWQGQRLSPRRLVGDALGASVAWQCINATSLLNDSYHDCTSAVVSAIGLNQQSQGAIFSPYSLT